MTEEEEKKLKRIKTAAEKWNRASVELSDALAANQAATEEARQELIKAWNALPEVKNVRYRITQNKKYFADMTGGKKYDYKNVLVMVSETEESDGYYSPGGRIIHIDKRRIDVPTVLIHEMLHYHIEEMTGNARVDLYAKLLKKLSRKIPNFDVILGLKDSVLISRCLREGITAPDPASHDNFFFVKSLDIDLRIMRPPGTVFGYGMNEALLEIDDALKRAAGLRLEAQYLPID